MRRAFRTRLRILAAILGVFTLFLVVRLYFLQVVHGTEYGVKAQRQYVSSGQELYDRGTIYFTRKDGTYISAATLQTGFLISIDPEVLKDPQSVYTAINSIYAINPATFNTAAGRTTSAYQVIAHHVPETEGQKIDELNIPGVFVERERWRVYPGGIAGAQTLGFVGYNDDNTYQGRQGLELQYESVLDRNAEGLFGNFFAELFGNIQNVVVDAKSARQGDVITSIEPEVEQKLDQAIKAVNDKYSSVQTGGIIMDTTTGEIIAMDTYPTFDPNDFAHENPQYFGNPLVQSRYEFGSIMKPLTMASGLDAGVITPDTTYNDTGCITVNSSKVCNYDLRARGVIPMQQILSQSLNVGVSFIATRLGHEKQRDYFTKLGFGEKTGINLPSEIVGDIHNLNSPRDIEHDNISFGQGISITPVEMIRALNTLSNYGSMVTPHLVTKVRLETGLIKPVTYPAPVRIFGTKAVSQVDTMLAYVVDNNLSNGKVKIPTMSVGAKTGTAQVVNPSTGKYYANTFFHSFFGFFPASHPRFIILLYTNRPQGVEYASEDLTPTFMELTHFLINYYAIPPDRGAYAQTQ